MAAVQAEFSFDRSGWPSSSARLTQTMTKTPIAATLILATSVLTAGAASAQVIWGPAYVRPYRYAYPPPYARVYPPPPYAYYPPAYPPYGPPMVYYGPPRVDYGPALPPPPPPPRPPPRYAGAPAPAAAPRRFEVYFPFDKADLDLDAREVIHDAAGYAGQTPGARLVVVGHTDTSGSDAHNDPLSQRRARAVQEALADDGVDAGATQMDWTGKRDLEVPTPDGVKESRNRRVTILVEPPA